SERPAAAELFVAFLSGLAMPPVAAPRLPGHSLNPMETIMLDINESKRSRDEAQARAGKGFQALVCSRHVRNELF
ncbi:MAG: hypothetical protein OXF88_21610, partial [Rhodobacteraceae bacterium]|nr:hypothetical protein [Paracoccaceae bacterium]